MNCNKILCVEKKPKNLGKLFFGDTGKYHRIDRTYFEVFKKLAETSESNTWFMNEISYDKDRIGWERLPGNAQRMFKLNITYQTLMDNGVPNIFFPLSEFVTDSWLSYLYSRIGTEEKIHSLSYSSGITQVFGEKGTEVLDLVYDDQLLKKRMEKEVYDSENLLQFVYTNAEESDDFKRAIIVLLLRVFFLEGVKFPFSFFVSWTINKSYDNAIQGFSQLLKLIAWDEMTVHTTTGSRVLKYLRNDEEQGFSHLFKTQWYKDTVYQMAKETAELEMEWSRYLLKDGSIPGYNEEIGDHVIKYFTDQRLKEISMDTIYNEKKSDIIDWYNDYRNLNRTSIALQEADTLNYQKGKLKIDFEDYDWSRFLK